jgi:hypothetical protein
MTAKPKTGKAIMTDEEIIHQTIKPTWEGDYAKFEVLSFMAQARQQGIEQGRADLLKEQKDKPKRNYRMVNRRKALRF